MEIMKTHTFPIGKFCAAVSGVLLASASLSFGDDLVLQKVPSAAPQPNAMTLGLVNYKLADAHAKARTLYVSSGADLKTANNITDEQTSTAYQFANGDMTPTTVIDLGKAQNVHRVAANFSAYKGSMAVYVVKALPDSSPNIATVDLPNSLRMSAETFSAMKPVAMIEDDGTRTDAAVDFPATSGRYVIVRWNNAVKQDTAFTVAEVAAFGGNNDDQTLATKKQAHRYNDVTDSKEMVDSKTVSDSKDIPAEGPPGEAAPPAEGPPPGLPPPPPFTFIPQIVPASP
jgi:hypothetical protein